MSAATSTYEVASAIDAVENFLRGSLIRHPKADGDSERTEFNIYAYGVPEVENLVKHKRHPATGIRVAEVSTWTPRLNGVGGGGASYMQVDVPHGIAVCGQTERCIIALLENWDESEGAKGEINAEFDRLAFAYWGRDWINHTKKYVEWRKSLNDLFPGEWYDDEQP